MAESQPIHAHAAQQVFFSARLLLKSSSVSVGQSFGRLTVAGVSFRIRDRGTRGMVVCECECGNFKAIAIPSLTGGLTRSCGCFASETARQRSTTHGATAQGKVTAEFMIWASMRKRCNNPTADCYDRYGGAGITVCQRWDESFSAFLEDMGPKPTKHHSIDRIDNSKGYEPSNCRWATATEQARNKKHHRLITAFGETLNSWQWSERFGISVQVICGRIIRGWNPERAVTEPVRPRIRKQPVQCIEQVVELLKMKG